MIEAKETLIGNATSSFSLSGKLNKLNSGGGTSDYEDLINQPSINDITLIGNKTLDELGIASKEYVEQEIATFDFVKIVQELPETGLQNRTYLVTKPDAADNDLYDEYIWINKGTEGESNWDWEYHGTKKIEVDLTNYIKNTDVATKTTTGVAKMWTSTNEDGEIGLNISTEV